MTKRTPTYFIEFWYYGLLRFQERDKKLDRCLAKNKYTQRKLLYFDFVNRQSVKKCQNLTFKINFQSQKSSEFF